METVFERKLKNALKDIESLKTPNCLYTVTIGSCAEGKLDREAREHAEKHIQSCLYCLSQYTEIRELLFYQKQKMQLSPPLVEKLEQFSHYAGPPVRAYKRIGELLALPKWFLKYAAVSVASICLTVIVLYFLKDGSTRPAIERYAFADVKAIGGSGETIAEVEGVVINDKGLVASDLAPLAGASAIEVRFRNGKVYQAKNVWKDEDKDLAVIKTDAPLLPAVAVLEKNRITIGQRAFIGTGSRRAWKAMNAATVTDLQVYEGRHRSREAAYIQLATTTPQTYRGVVVDRDGRLMGLMVTKDDSINLAAPLKDLEKLTVERSATPLSELKLSRFSAEAHDAYMKGTLAVYAQEWDNAMDLLKKAVRLNPGLERAHMELGYIYCKKQMYAPEAKEYEEVLRINPKNFSALFSLAGNLQARGLYNEAIKLYESAVLLAPEDEDTLYELGLAYLAEGQQGKALEIFVKLRQINARTAAILLKLAI